MAGLLPPSARAVSARTLRSLPGGSQLLQLAATFRRHRRLDAVRRAASSAGLGALTEAVVLVDHPSRTVVRAVTTAGPTVYAKLDAVPARIDREQLALEAARAGGMPTPCVLAADRRPPGVLITEGIAGQPLDDAASDPSWRSTGELLRRLHDTPPPDGLRRAPTHRSWEDRRIDDALQACAVLRRDRLLALAEIDRIEDHVTGWLRASLGDRDAFIHGDCMAKHVFIEGDRAVGLIDWADAQVGDPFWDLAVVSKFARHRVPTLLQGYGVAPSDIEGVAGALAPHWDLRDLLGAAWCRQHGYDPQRHLEALRRLGTAP